MSNEILYHVSEIADIKLFEPRTSESHDDAFVWAITGDRLHNYLLPRACPRVAYFANGNTVATDVERFLGSSPGVVAVESDWADRIRNTVLYCYEFAPEAFTCLDAGAGYYVSRSPVKPIRRLIIDDPMQAIRERGVELRFLEDLRGFAASIVASTLQFSLIRMRNAK
ncbi:MAG: DUF6886 family protein [Gemmatimonadaceae bacterium]